jgi:TP901 family phage tail tape measure protein
LTKQISTLNSGNLSALSSELKKIANPKFNWDPGLKQMDELTAKIQKGRLSAGEYFNTLRKGTSDLVMQQERLAKAYATPIGNKGGMAMTIPSAATIAPTITAMEKLNRTWAVQSELLSGLGTKIQDWGKNTQWAGRQMMVGFTVPFAMAAVAAGKYAMDIDKALTRIEKVYDGSTQGLREEATAVAMDITRQLGQTVQSSLEIMGELAAAGKQGAEMYDMTRQAQRLSVLGDVDKEESIKAVISMQTIYGLNTKQLADSINYLNAVDAKTPTSMKDLADAIPIAGATVKQLGGDLKDTTVLLSAFKERGINTVEGANAIKSAMNRVLVPTAQAKKLFQEFTKQDLTQVVERSKGDPLDTMQALSDAIMGGNVALDDQQRIISKLFGTYQSTRITGLLQGLQSKTGAVAATKDLAAKSDGELRSIAEKHEAAIRNSASRQFTTAVESFKAQLKEFGDYAMKVGTSVVSGFSKAFAFFNSLPGPIKTVAIALGLVVAAAGPIVMLAGLFGNLFGSVIKFTGFLMGLKKGYSSMTIEQKAAQLAAEGMTTKLMSESEAAQVLIFQMGKLLGAIQAVDTAQAKTTFGMGTPGAGMAMTSTQTRAVQNPVTGEWRTNTGKSVSASEAAELNAQQKALTAEKENTAKAETKVAEEVKKTSVVQKAFSTEALVGVGAIAGIGSMVAETGSGFEKWLTYISLGSIALSGIIPLVTKVAEIVKGTSMFSAITGATGGLAAKFGGLGASIGSSLKNGLSSALSFMKSPMGIGIGVALAGVLAVTKLVSAEAERQEEKHQQILRSTDDWTKALGRTKVEWGQIKDEAGKVEDTVASMAEKMKTDNAPMVERFRNQGGTQELQYMANTEVGNLMGQGMNKTEILNAMEALLRAAGKTRTEIDQILGNIKVQFDFNNTEKDFDSFMDTVRKKVGALQFNLFDTNSTQYDDQGTPNLSGDSLQNLNRQTEELAQQFKDRIANMSDVDRAVFARKFADSMAATYSDAFKQLNSQYGDKLGKDWQDARKKFMSFDQGSGEWKLNDAGMRDISGDAAQKLVYLAKEESDLTKAIAKANGASDDQVKKISVIGDIMPYLSQGVGDATKVQQSYNKAVEAYEQNAGRKMTDVEKDKLAALYASVAGLDKAKLATNGYAQAGQNLAKTAIDNANALKKFTDTMKEAGSAGKDMWDDISDPGGGFSSLGGTVEQQAQKLTDVQKNIFGGSMNSVYDAFSGSAEEIWKGRLDAITKSFEEKKDRIQAAMDSFDKSYEKKQQDFEDRWDATMDATKDSFDNRQKAIENEADARIKSIDAQVDAIQNQKEAEQEIEDARQKQFEAEKQRIERLSSLANQQIAYNRALAGGNLDEAARVQNNTESMTTGWSIDDANSRASDAAEKKSKLSDKQIKDLNASKDVIQQQKQAKLDALKDEEAAVEKSLQKQREMEKRSMEAARDIERERLQNRLDSLNKEQQAAEAKEQKIQEQNKRTLEIQLATLKAFIPQNEQQLNDHINRVGAAYGQFGLGLQGAGSQWGQIVGNALQNNVDIARNQMSSDANWSAFGAQVAGAISQGAFGLNLNDFMNLLRTGNPPAGWTPPGANAGYNSGGFSGNGIRGARHAGGPVDDSPGTRLGRTGALQADELNMTLQRGEFVINKAAVQKLGKENLSRINAGDPKALNPGVNFAGFGGAFAGIMGRAMTDLAVNQLASYYAAQNSTIAEALGMTGGSGTGAAVDFAKAQDGKPYIWGGVGPAGYDCSGYMSAIANVLTGKNPHQRLYSTGMVWPRGEQAFGPFLPGLGGKFQIGVSNGHTAGTLLGTNVESTGNHVRYGKDAHGATDKQFGLHFHIPDDKIVEGSANWDGTGEQASGNVQQLVKAVASKYGWDGGSEWNALYALIQKESSWNPTAQNPTSSAYGLFQFLNSTWGPYGGKTSNATLQAQYGLRYIQGRYGDPIGAWAFHRAHNWYDSGGDVMPGHNMLYNGTNLPESVLTNSTTKGVIDALNKATMSYTGFAGLLQNAIAIPSVSAGFDTGAGDTYTYEVNINAAGMAPDELRRVVSDAIDNKHRLQQKKLGVIR